MVFDPVSDDFFADLYAIYRRMRIEAPLYYNEAEDFYALTRHDDVAAAYKDHETFSSARGLDLAMGTDAETFNIDRDRSQAQNLGLGYGIHSCLGAALARLETAIALASSSCSVVGGLRPRNTSSATLACRISEFEAVVGVSTQEGIALPSRPRLGGVIRMRGPPSAEGVAAGLDCGCPTAEDICDRFGQRGGVHARRHLVRSVRRVVTGQHRLHETGCLHRGSTHQRQRIGWMPFGFDAPYRRGVRCWCGGRGSSRRRAGCGWCSPLEPRG